MSSEMIGGNYRASEAARVLDAVERFHAAGFAYGELISKAWIEWALGVEDKDADHLLYMRLSRGFKEALKHDHKVHLGTVHAKGQWYIPPDKQVGCAMDDMYHGVCNVLRKTGDRLDHCAVDEMSVEQRRERVDAKNKVDGFQRLMLKGNRDVFADFKALEAEQKALPKPD
ncbi:MAG: hypothetical protein L0H63_10005 [Nitrococcus sp.]|nr:hypothetical protein [Nitrococcus sp.]